MSTRLWAWGLCLILASCGAKDTVSVSGEPNPLDGGRQREVTRPGPGEAPDRTSLVQIACHAPSSGNLTLPNSLSASGERASDTILSLGGEGNLAPTLLEVRANAVTGLFQFENKMYLFDYDFGSRRLAASPRVLGEARSRATQAHLEIGISRTRSAAVAPNGLAFVIPGATGYSLRETSRPEVEVGRWPVSRELVQLRWEGNEVFADQATEPMRQAVISVDEEGRYLNSRTMPAPARGFAQVGLTRLDADRYVWLEWKDGRGRIRTWSPETDRQQSFELPNREKFGAGLALWRASAEAAPQLALNTRNGIYFYAIEGGALVQKKLSLYPESVARAIEESEKKVPDIIEGRPKSWQPGAIYSAAGGSQLFVILPHIYGRMLFAVDGGRAFRSLSQDDCSNPHFYLVRK